MDEPEQPRRRYNIGARKIPKRQRDVADRILGNARARYRDIINSDDDDTVPIGAPVTYSAELTDAEAAEFAAASNARYVELDTLHEPAAIVDVPGDPTLKWLDADSPGQFTGAGTTVCVCDSGTTQIVRDQLPLTLLARRNFTDIPYGPDEVPTDHGSTVTCEAVPPGARLLDAQITQRSGGAYASTGATALRWAADNGAQVCNYSFAGTGEVQVMTDAIRYLAERGVQLVAAAGNNNLNEIRYPAAHSRDFPNVHSSGAFDLTTDDKAGFSNYHEDLSGVAPGVAVPALNAAGQRITWSGTSCSSPLMARLIAMGATGGIYSPQQVAHALRASARDTGQPRTEQGSGAWNLENALALLADDAAPHPEVSMHAYATAKQLVLTGTDTRVKFPVQEYGTPDVETNSAKDVFTIKRSGRYLVTATARFDAFAAGERYFGIGNDLSPAQTGAVRYAGQGTNVPSGPVSASLATTRRLVTGDRIAVWAFQSTGNALDLLPAVGQAGRTVSVSIDRIGD